jgi:hypothetical protein
LRPLGREFVMTWNKGSQPGRGSARAGFPGTTS